LPTPSATKRLLGTYRADRANAGEPEALPLPDTLTAPAWLDARGVAAWDRLVPMLRQMDVLGGQDLELLAILADTLSTYEAAAECLKGKGSLSFVVTDGDGTPKGLVPYPEVKIKAAAAQEIRRLAEHFGLSPASRSRVSTTGGDGADLDAARLAASPLLRLQLAARSARGPQGSGGPRPA
jgi:P27 family predicted phage terminase small subunit